MSDIQSSIVNTYNSMTYGRIWSDYLQDQRFEVGRLRDRRHDGVVLSLNALFEQSYDPLSVQRSSDDNVLQLLPANVIRARAGDQDSAGTEHLQGPQIQFFVAPRSGRKVALGLGERWRVENDGVVLTPGRGIVLEQVKGVGLHPFDL